MTVGGETVTLSIYLANSYPTVKSLPLSLHELKIGQSGIARRRGVALLPSTEKERGFLSGIKHSGTSAIYKRKSFSLMWAT
ncbi:hypothetical protein Tsubulata_020172 [Turnera subulata]|uniref:Uncharacterized protein n=1 Tax=Turnera subulata TaxID=218843 RepID=A0A9Q0FRK0_9ROSI|nr:hypothetical protein Tsubulata_020172 [Turnera subulata]